MTTTCNEPVLSGLGWSETQVFNLDIYILEAEVKISTDRQPLSCGFY